MNRIACIVLAVVMLCAFAMPVLALDETDGTGSVTVSAEVPSSHKITVHTDGGAAVIFGNETVAAAGDGDISAEYSVPRLGTPQVIIRPRSGRHVKSVSLNGADITGKFIGGRCVLEPVCGNLTLVVVTESLPEAENPATFTVEGVITGQGNTLSGVTLELRSEPKTAVTDSEGKFSFDNVAAGHHSLTAIVDNAVIGYMEFTLSDSAVNVDFTLKDGIYSVNVPGSTATIRLELTLGDNESIAITGVTAHKAPANAFAVIVCVVVAVCVITAICLFAVYRRRKRGGNK